MIDQQVHDAQQKLSAARRTVVSDARLLLQNPQRYWLVQQLAAGVLAAERAEAEFVRLAHGVVHSAAEFAGPQVWVEIGLEDM